LRALYFVGAGKICAISSAVERLLHTQEVAGSNPASRTARLRQVAKVNAAGPSGIWLTETDQSRNDRRDIAVEKSDNVD
jgi:hypothetical protein